ncbi:hypothetical protein BWG23_15315 [Flavobacterium oreochromis]|nr:hypothetical protein BWG23_15315 [Flavobacterium oreochromis]
MCGNFFHKKKLHKVVWKKKFLKKTTQLCAEKIFFKKNYTKLCGKNILKKNPHNFVDTPNRGCPKSKKSTHSLSLQRKEEFHNQYYVIWPVRAELSGLPLID